MRFFCKGFFFLIVILFIGSNGILLAQKSNSTISIKTDTLTTKENEAVITTSASSKTNPINNPDKIIKVDNTPKVAPPQEKNTGFIEVQGRNIDYYNLRQKDELVALFTPYGLKEGANGHFYISRCYEVTKGWNGSKLYNQTLEVIIDLETFYSSD